MALLRVPVSSLTPSEVSAAAAQLVPPAGEASRHLAGLVDQAVYAGIADDAAAAEAWVSSDSVVRALVEAVPDRPPDPGPARRSAGRPGSTRPTAG